MKLIKLILCIFVCFMLLACDKKDEKEEIFDINNYSSEELFKLGWDSFAENHFDDALEYFSILNTKEDAYLLGHYGLGWTFLKQFKYHNAQSQFNKFFTNDSLEVFINSDSIFIDVKAGLCIVKNAFKQYDSVIVEAGFVPENWVFKYIPDLNYLNIVLLKALAEYNLGLFTDCLQSINIIEPEFITDITTIEGRLVLMQKLEQLIIRFE